MPKIEIDNHCGAGHKRIHRFIPDKELRDKIIKTHSKKRILGF